MCVCLAGILSQQSGMTADRSSSRVSAHDYESHHAPASPLPATRLVRSAIRALDSLLRPGCTGDFLFAASAFIGGASWSSLVDILLQVRRLHTVAGHSDTCAALEPRSSSLVRLDILKPTVAVG